jgi:class 3 adenylate cyclase
MLAAETDCGVTMGGERRIRRASLGDPERRLAFGHGGGEFVRVGPLAIGRATLRPGWRWSTDLGPEVGTPSCLHHHFHVQLSGRMAFQLDGEGPEEFVAGDVFDVPPGHDAWVVGDEPVVVLDVAGTSDLFGVALVPGGVVATILMTDIVDSTPTAARLGDPAWRQVLAQHHRVVRAQLERFGGREVDTTGDGFLATFESAVAAIHAGRSIRDVVAAMGIACRVGIHTGEIQEDGDEVAGLAVHLAARVMAAAAPSEVLVSEVTRALIAGRGFRLADRGRQTLKGFAEPVGLSAVD